MRREAGTLSFDGSFRDGRGAGLFTFGPREAYANEMRSLGFRVVTVNFRNGGEAAAASAVPR